MALIRGLHFNNLRGDLYGGLVAAVVALPLALAFGVASGAGAVAGLYGAIVVGLFAAMFGGTPAQVSGPTGPMTVVMAGLLTQFSHEPSLAFTAVILGGGLQILLGMSGVAQYITLMPYPVVSGFMSGIGAIIIILQVGPLVGHAPPTGDVLYVLVSLPSFIAAPVTDALLLGMVSLLVMYGTPEWIGKVVPPPLIALIAGTVLGVVVFPAAPVIGAIPQGFPLPSFPTLHLDAVHVVIEEAIVLAMLGSLDSLLTSLVCDNMTRTNHDSNRELIGQGIGNAVAGLLGGLPGAGATMRSVVNIRSGGQTPLAGMWHAIVLLALLLGLGWLAERIPLAVLAGILIKVGVDIIDWRFLKHVRDAPREDMLIMLVVGSMTILADLIMAVAIGLVLASVLFVKRMADLELMNLRIITDRDGESSLTDEERTVLSSHKGRIILIHIGGPMSFGSAKNMVRRLEGIARWNNFSVVVLDLSKVPAIDGSAAMAVEDMIRMAQASRKHLILSGTQPHVKEVLKGLGVLKLLRPDHQFASRVKALQHAAKLADGPVAG